MGSMSQNLAFGDRQDATVHGALHGTLKRKALLEHASDPAKSIAERRNKIEIGRDFSIISGRDSCVRWRLPVLAAALSGVLKEKYLGLATPEHTATLPSRFDHLVIDIMVKFVMYDSYRLTQPLRLQHVQNASGLNKNLTASINTTTPILIHLSVFEIGKFLDIPELAADAMGKIQFILSQRSDPMPITVFEKVVSRVWYEVDRDAGRDMHEDMHALRCKVASYGTTMEYVFNKQNEDLYDELLALDGKYKEYAKWHMEGAKLRNQATGFQHAPFIQALIAKDAKDAKDAEVTADEN